MSSPDLEPGTLFAREYRVVRPLRSGGMGSVHVVEHVGTGKLRALKLLAPELELHDEMRERFVREARAASAIESDHVVEIITAGIDEASNRPFIIMELLQGEDLGDRIEHNGPLDRKTLRSVLRQLGHALGAAHRAGIIHRDLKPENVFLAEGRRPGAELTVKLLDFGVAKILQRGSPQAPTQPLGSPLFMSPEQTDAEGEITPGTDVWSLGLLAFYLLTGDYFWIAAESCSVPALLREVCFDELPPASVRAKVFGADSGVLPPGFDEWFRRCVSRNLEERFADGEVAANALVEILERDEAGEAAPLDEVARTFASAPPTERNEDHDAWPGVAPPPADLPAPAELWPEGEDPWREDTPDPLVGTPRNGGGDRASQPRGSAPPEEKDDAPPPPPTVKAASTTGPAPALATPIQAEGEAPEGLWRRVLRRYGAARHIAGGVVAGCLGGALCFVIVGHVTVPVHVAAPSSTPAATGSAVHAAVLPPPPPPPSARVVETTARPEPPPPALAPSAKRVAPRYEPREVDAGCAHGMRRILRGKEAFCIDAEEVSVSAWSSCVDRGACAMLDGAIRHVSIRADGIEAARVACARGTEPSLPVNCIDRDAAAAFCDDRGARLPSDEEWTAAAFGGTAGRRFPWGEEVPDATRANLCDESCVDWAVDLKVFRTPAFAGDDGAAIIAPTGSFPRGRSPDDVLDLAGNVAEWTSSERGDEAVVRGGSFLTSPAEATRDARLVDPRASSPEIGFRCASGVDDHAGAGAERRP